MSNQKKPTLYLGSNIKIIDNVVDFGKTSLISSEAPTNNNDIVNKIYVDDKINTEATIRANKDAQLENEIVKLKDMLATLQTSTNALLDTHKRKINDLYLYFWQMNMDQAIGVDPNTFKMIFQYGPGTIEK